MEKAPEVLEVSKYTRAEAEKIVRSIKRTCRGLPVLSVEDRNKFFTAYKKAEADQNWPTARAITSHTEDAAGVVGQQIENGNWEKLNARFHTAVFAHGDQVGKPCNRDFNDIICAGLFDGKQHEYICPGCGQKGSYGAPLFDIEEDATNTASA